jgi:hypothetical protein
MRARAPLITSGISILRIAEQWDNLGMLQQLTVVPTMGQAG